jgi:hypothetical protein
MRDAGMPADRQDLEDTLLTRAMWSPDLLSDAEAEQVATRLARVASRFRGIADARAEGRPVPDGLYDRAAAELRNLMQVPEILGIFVTLLTCTGI